MEQLTSLRAFRQAIYARSLTRRRDAQQELLDALLLSPMARSLPYLSLSPIFRRRWHSAYAALEDGDQDRRWITQFLTGHVPTDFPERGVEVFALDETAWPRRDAPSLPERRYVYGGGGELGGPGITVGHSYSILAWSAEASTSWVLPLSVERITSHADALSVATAQIKALRQQRPAAFDVIVADAFYSQAPFLGAAGPLVEDLGGGLLARLRSNRVLYGQAGPYAGRGRKRRHGRRFSFREPGSWGAPEQLLRLSDARFGQVELRLWEGLHGRRSAETVFSVVRCQVHAERARPPEAMWLAWVGPRWPVEELWRYYQRRALLEQSIRYRKQALLWTRPQLGSISASERWTQLVTLAQWTLFLARDRVAERRLPWQAPLQRPSPGRVRQSLGVLFVPLGTPARAVKERGKAPGWPVGRRRASRARHAVERKGSQASLGREKTA